MSVEALVAGVGGFMVVWLLGAPTGERRWQGFAAYARSLLLAFAGVLLAAVVATALGWTKPERVTLCTSPSQCSVLHPARGGSRGATVRGMGPPSQAGLANATDVPRAARPHRR